MTRSLMRLWLFAAMVLAGAGSSAFAAPAYRIEDAMVYDPIGQRHIMFGGYDSHGGSIPETRFNDIWEYDGATRTWYNVTPAGGAMPVPRSGHAFVFDPTRRVVVLFGGWNPTQGYLSDTWEWNCAARTWTQISTSTAPSARQGARMIYDAAGNRLILFGGVDVNRFYNDTWRYSAGTWTRVTTTASSSSNRTFNGRTFHGLVYNTARGSLLIFGGIGYPNLTTQGTVTDFDDMWELVGTTWTDITPSGTKPGGRGWFGMTYEIATNRVVVYGGWNNTSRFTYADTWAWNGSTWSQIAANSAPGSRDSFAMTYDTARFRSVVFGGYWSDLWELSGSTWISVTTTDGVGPPPPQPTGPVRPDITVYRPSEGTWYSLLSSTNFTQYQVIRWGQPGDQPLSADFDGDGRLDRVVYGPSDGRWSVLHSSTNFDYTGAGAASWGSPGDIPVPSDFDGDRRADLAVFRPSNGTWYIRFSASGYSYSNYQAIPWGLPGDIPLQADFNGDGRADLVVYRPSTGTWHVLYAYYGYEAATAYHWGLPGDIPMAEDFDGDGKTDLAVYRPSTGYWYVRYSSSNYSYSNWAAFAFGSPGDVPIRGDYDADGKADVVVYRPSNANWYFLLSSTGYDYRAWRSYGWGLAFDMPVGGK
jgi:Galactose oxidase, central domain/FG-GAP-like repeat/Kelch motif